MAAAKVSKNRQVTLNYTKSRMIKVRNSKAQKSIKAKTVLPKRKTYLANFELYHQVNLI